MFGLFKKQITPAEFGQGIVHLASEWLAFDSGKSLGMRFENWDASNGWSNFLVSRGVSAPIQKQYFRLFSHCAIQGACTQFDPTMRAAVTRGAMSEFIPDAASGYSFEQTYKTLEASYRGTHRFRESLEMLQNPTAQLSFLPNPNVGIINAKYLIDTFIISHLQNSKTFFDKFESYSIGVSVAVTTVHRAMGHIFKSFKVR